MSKAGPRKAMRAARIALAVVVAYGVPMLIGSLLLWPGAGQGPSRLQEAVRGCQAVKQSGELYLNLTDGPEGACPSVDDLVRAKQLEPQRTLDPWGAPYRIHCEGDELRVVSAGPDGVEGTADDLRDDSKHLDVGLWRRFVRWISRPAPRAVIL